MFGCLKGIIGFIILTLAVIGFLSIGGDKLVMNGLNGYLNQSAEKSVEIKEEKPEKNKKSENSPAQENANSENSDLSSNIVNALFKSMINNFINQQVKNIENK